MRWELEELAEDCIVSYLEGEVDGQLKVFGAWNFNEPEFPCAIVHVAETSPVVEMATWHDARQAVVEVAVMTDAAAEIDTTGNEVKATRERHTDAKTLILNALCKTGLVTSFNEAAIALQKQIAFSMAQVTNTARTVDADTRKLITTVSIEVIIEPVTGS